MACPVVQEDEHRFHPYGIQRRARSCNEDEHKVHPYVCDISRRMLWPCLLPVISVALWLSTRQASDARMSADSVLSRVGGFLVVLVCPAVCAVLACHRGVWRWAGANHPGYSDRQGIQITDLARRNPRHLQRALARVTVLALALAPPLSGCEIAVDRPDERCPLQPHL